MISKKYENLKLLSNIIKYLSLRRKISFLIFFILTCFSAFFDILSIGLVIPFMDLMVNPDKYTNYLTDLKFLLPNFFYKEKNYLNIITLVFISSILASTFLRIIVFNLSQKISYFVNFEFNIIFYKKILNFRYNYNNKKKLEESEVISVINKIDFISNYINSFLNFFIGFFITFIICFTLFWHLSYKIFLIMSFFIFIYLLIIFFARKKLNHNSFVISGNISIKNLHISNTLGLFKEIILNNLKYYFFSKFSKINYQLTKSVISNSIISTIPGIILTNFTIILFVVFISILASQNNSILEKIPFLSAIIFGVQKCTPLFYQMYSSLTRMRGAFHQANNAINLLNSLKENKKDSFQVSKKNKLVFNNIKYKKISFKYDKNKEYILKNLNFEFKKGEKILLQGPSGAGKTTLVNIILGFLFPSSGVIKINNTEIGIKKYRNLTSFISYCPQNIFLMKDNFTNNISLNFTKELIDKNRIINSAKIASIHKYIMLTKKRYDTEIYQGATNLSGGQIQRIGIARALYKKSQIIIFDEATNSIDAKTEIKILNNIFKFNKDKTIILLSHKNYEKKLFDKVYILKKKKLFLVK